MDIVIVTILDQRNLFQYIYLAAGNNRDRALADAWEEHKKEANCGEEEKPRHVLDCYCISSFTEMPRLIPRLCYPLRQQ